MFCENCKYWKYYCDTYSIGWHECDLLEVTELKEGIYPNVAALYAEALDDSGLMVGLKTGPLFGCVNFEASNDKVL